jgi:magnesium-transporting ATPase (P-type)
MIFSGTAATCGHGKAVVTATGMQTEMGRIARLLKETQDEATPLQRELDRTGKRLGIAVIAIAIVMIATIISSGTCGAWPLSSTCSACCSAEGGPGGGGAATNSWVQSHVGWHRSAARRSCR